MHNQLVHLPESKVVSYVVCEKSENLDLFPTPNLYSLENCHAIKILWDKLLRLCRLRRHLGFLSDIVRNTNAQILHSHFGNIGWANLGATRNTNTKHIITFYGLDVNLLPQSNPVWLKRYAQLFKQADLFLCEGPHMANELKKMGCPNEKVKVHHLGIELNNIAYKPRSWRPPETLKFLIAGSFREKKGIPNAIMALGQLKKQLNLSLTIIGDANNAASSQQEKQRIYSALDDAQMRQCTTLLGYQPYSRLMNEAYNHHVFISPSITAKDGDTEGGAPVTITEMMASGMIVASTKHCDIPNLISDGETGVLAEENDIMGLVNRLQWLVSSVEAWPGIQYSARQHVEKNFDAVRQGEQLYKHYKDLS